MFQKPFQKNITLIQLSKMHGTVRVKRKNFKKNKAVKSQKKLPE